MVKVKVDYFGDCPNQTRGKARALGVDAQLRSLFNGPA